MIEMTPALSRQSLPTQTTPFVGRVRELQEITRLLADPNRRLLTLVGPGGIGKTRLALEVAAARAEHFRDGVVFVSLASVSSQDYLVSTIARAIQFDFFNSDDARQHLLKFLGELQLMLVMDNFEHLLDGVTTINEILAHAPEVTILVTSRERLRLTSETVYNVDGLDFHADDIATSEAASLFLESGRRLRPDLKLQPDDLQHLTRICQLVGGMPLGILLAATWVQTLSLAEIAEEITRSLDFLETRMHDIPERQHSIRAVFDQLWRHLSNEERVVFSKTAVFCGSFERGAFEAVTGGSLRLLATLVDKSLVRRDDDGRYRIHELLQQYALEHLKESPADEQAVRQSHARYYAHFLSGKLTGLLVGRPQAALEAIDNEIENVRAAWRTLAEQHMAAEIHQCATSLWYYCLGRFETKEGIELFQQALQSLEAASHDLEVELTRAVLMVRLGTFYSAYGYGSPEKGKAIIEEGLAILRARGDKEELVIGLINLVEALLTIHGWTPLKNEDEDWDWTPALEEAHEGLSIAREMDDLQNVAHYLYLLSWIAFTQRNYQEAWELGDEALALFRKTNNLWMVGGLGAALLSQIAENLGNYEIARQLRYDSLPVAEEIGSALDMGHHYAGLGYIAYLEKDYDEAKRCYRQAIQLYNRVPGNKGRWSISGTLISLGKLWAAQGMTVRAVEVLSCVRTTFAYIPEKRAWSGEALENIKGLLPPDTFEAALERGRSMDMNTLVQEFLSDAEPVDKESSGTQGQPDALTERELEIIGLIAQGMSNRQISEELIFAIGTVKWYINQIFGKLHVSNRTQLVARARELNLIP